MDDLITIVNPRVESDEIINARNDAANAPTFEEYVQAMIRLERLFE